MKKTLFICIVLLGALIAPTQSHAQFKNLVNKAKEKAKEVVKETTDEAANQVNPATNNVVNAARPALPWPMQSNNPSYNGMGISEFLANIADQSDESLTVLRDQMYARYKANASLISAGGEGAYEAQTENERFTAFYFGIRQVLNIVLSNVYVSNNGAINADNGRFLVTTRKGGGIGYFVGNKDGKFQFVTPKDDGAFLESDDLAIAKDAAVRMRKYQTLTYAFRELFASVGEQCDKDMCAMYNLCGICANAMEKACANNTVENIERKPRPANGSMHASLKAEALRVAQAADKDVIDVIITSNSWDVKMKGAIPVNRNVYGYYLVKDQYGTQCLSRAWTEDYIGDGKYGAMHVGGVGTASPFYIQ